MGMTVSACAGLGLELPLDALDVYVPDLLEEHNFDLLVHHESIWGYESSGAAMFALSQFSSTEDGAPFKFASNGSVSVTEAEEIQLREVAKLLGIPYDLRFIFLHSYQD